MQRRTVLCFCGKAALLAPVLAAGSASMPAAAAPGDLSAADRAFVAKVSQGGMYEVEASKLAAQAAARQDILDIGATEAHDHQLVGAKLKAIAGSVGIELDAALNPGFQRRLDRLRGLSGKAFDNAYIREMDAVHAADGAAFAQEARAGHNPARGSSAADPQPELDDRAPPPLIAAP